MKVLGIVAEYNPFHNGHFYHLNESQKTSDAEVTVCIMSGNFVQRGEVAILSKWERAKIATLCGVDLVLELPFVYACNSAEYFAKGAVQILDGICLVDTISFGSESGNVQNFSDIAHLLLHETDEFKDTIKASLDKGNSFPKARAEAIQKILGGDMAETISQSNNILAVEYIKELMNLNSSITPITVLRKGPADNSDVTEKGFASATGIRKLLENRASVSIDADAGINSISEYVPDECFATLKNSNINIKEKNDNLFMLLTAKVLSKSENELDEIFSTGEGLGNKLKKAIREAKDLESLIDAVKSKRYTRTRIQRLLIHTLLDFKKPDFEYILNNQINYTKVLAFNDKGASLLKKIKKVEPKLPVITNINKEIDANDDIMKLLKYDILASDIYNLISGFDVRDNSEHVMAPYNKK